MSEEATLDEFVASENKDGIDKNEEGQSDEWQEVSLINLCDMGGGSTPKKSNPEYWEGGKILWTSPKDFDGPRLKDTEDKITEKGAEESTSKIYPPGTTLLVVRSGVLRHTLPVSIAEKHTTVNQDLKALEPYKEKVNPEYFFQALSGLSEDIRRSCKKTGTTVESIQTNVLEQYPVPVPSKSEQRKIATILYTVDQAIENTEEIIEQVERLERGTIQALLSEGTRKSVTKKDTPIGEVPDHWDVRQVGDLTNVTVGYVQNIDGHFTNSEKGIQLYRTKDISSRGLQVQEEAYVTQEFHENNTGSQLTAGDLIVARHGDSGQAAVIPESTPKAHCQNVVIVRSSEKFLSKFLEYLFNYEVTRRRLLAWQAGSVQKVVSTTAVQNFRIPLPPIEEQREIVEKLASLNHRLENEDTYLQTLHVLRHGLMQDLLSGTVRTTDTNIEVPDEVAQYG